MSDMLNEVLPIAARKLRANTIRILSMDMVQKANSGHPGMPMGMADIAEVLWHDFLNHYPDHPKWPNRDRFILSNGHGCALLYALLHLTGYALTLSDLKQFRKLHSKTPGHPEWKKTPGVETTTGPLGQGLANAVGMAIAEKHLAATFNRPHFQIIDYYVYVFVGDGCLMEGISHEVCSLAGVLSLGKLIVFYDDNGVSIDGAVKHCFKDNTPQRFTAYGWQVISVDGHDGQAIYEALRTARMVLDRPTLICCKTVIGWGSPHCAGSHRMHGAPLADDEAEAVRQYLKWEDPPFSIPDEIYKMWNANKRGRVLEESWNRLFSQYQSAHPDLARDFQRRLSGEQPKDDSSVIQSLLQRFGLSNKQTMATRQASQICIEAYAEKFPEIMIGSADLTESNGLYSPNLHLFNAHDPSGRRLWYGVREFGMAAIMNGMALSHMILPIGGTFLTFSDYNRNAIRLAALMQLQVIFVLTHDSIGLGEDGPTHQPIEQLPSLRLIPNLSVWRPCDGIETAIAWSAAVTQQGPCCLILSRQALLAQSHTQSQLRSIRRGGYILLDYAMQHGLDFPAAILLATGSEVQLATEAAKVLCQSKIYVRVVSLPCIDVFLKQEKEYQNQVLPQNGVVRFAIEAAASHYWHFLVKDQENVFGIDRFGMSAPGNEVLHYYGFSVQRIVDQIKQNCFLNK